MPSSKEVFESILEAWNTKDLGKFKDLCTPDFAFTAGPNSMTLEEYVAVMNAVYASFPDIHFEASDVAEDGDTVTVGKGKVCESGLFFCLRCGMV